MIDIPMHTSNKYWQMCLNARMHNSQASKAAYVSFRYHLCHLDWKHDVRTYLPVGPQQAHQSILLHIAQHKGLNAKLLRLHGGWDVICIIPIEIPQTLVSHAEASLL